MKIMCGSVFYDAFQRMIKEEWERSYREETTYKKENGYWVKKTPRELKEYHLRNKNYKEAADWRYVEVNAKILLI